MSTTVKPPALAWISAHHLQHMIARGEASGLPMAALLDEAGLTTARLADAPVPLSAIESLLAGLSHRYGDPLIGLHLASDIPPATFGTLGYIFQACTTFADVLETPIRFNGLLSNIGCSELVYAPGVVTLRWTCLAGGDAFRRHATEYVLGAFAVLSRLLVPEQKMLLQAVHFSHARPDDPERLREYASFFQCPVYFDQPFSAVVIPASALKIRLRHGDAFIKDLLERHALNLLQQRQQDVSLVDNVRHLIASMLLDGAPTREIIAQQLGMSPRSLHRKLQDLNTCYRDLLDQTRLALATTRLHDETITVNMLAAQLGFQSHQAFLRWFKQMTGLSPSQYRQQHPTTPNATVNQESTHHDCP